MKKLTQVTALPIALLMVVGSTQAFAQARTGLGIVGVQQSPGNYSFRQYDQAKLESEILKVVSQRGDDDRQFVQDRVTQINAALEALRRNHLVANSVSVNIASLLNTYGVGMNHALDSSQQDVLAAALNSVRKFKADEADLRNLIGTVTMIPSIVKNSDQVKIDGNSVDLRGYGKVDFSHLISFYSGQLDQIDAQLSSSKIMVMQNFGAPTLQDVLNISLGNAYTAEQLTAMRDNAERMMALGTLDQNRMKQVHLFTFNQLNTIIQVFGKDQRYRLNLNADQRDQVVHDFQRLLWMRSLLRASTGIPGIVGTFGVQYQKLALNKDIMTDIVDLKMSIEPITRQSELMQVRDAIVYKLFQLETRTKNPLSLQTYQAAFTSLTNAISAVNSLRTFLDGRMQEADVTKIILKELAYDAQEEYLLATGNFAEMRRVYQSRWYSGKSAAEIAAIKTQAQQLMSNAPLSSNVGPVALNGQANTDNMTGIFVIAKNTIRDYSARYERAQQIMAVYTAATADQSTTQAIDKNVSDL